jgi:Na+-driven multidrug efflux pump
MAIIYPFGPTVMDHLYLEGKPKVAKLAVQCLYIITFGMSLDYLCGVGNGVVQGYVRAWPAHCHHLSAACHLFGR